jgi:predicted transposase/invertase (TIGR01784 family)
VGREFREFAQYNAPKETVLYKTMENWRTIMAKRKLISFDWAMKKLLRSKANFEILEGFLSELLKEDVRIQEILESESNRETARDKFNRVDLKVKNTTGDILIIEVQYDREFDYLQRIFYGTAKAVTEHIGRGEAYSEITKVISISILYFDLGQGTDYVYHGITSFRGLHNSDLLLLSGEQQALFGKDKVHELLPEYYLIKVNSFDDIAKDSLDEWIYFLKNEEIREEFSAKGLDKAKQELDIMKFSDEERRAYAAYQEDLHYQASMVESTWTAGMLKGKEEGFEQGREEGEAQGRREEKRAIAASLLESGLLDAEKIATMTGLTMEEVKGLQVE